MAQCQGLRAQMVRLFFGLHLYLARRCCENLQSARGPARCNSGPGNNMITLVSRRDHLLYHFSIAIHLHLSNYYATKYFWNKLAKGNVRWTNYWISIEGAWAPWQCMCSTTGYFHEKTKISEENIRVDYYLLLKYCRRQCPKILSTWAKSVTKFNLKMQDLMCFGLKL